MKKLVFAAVSTVALMAACVASPSFAQQVSLQPYANANVSGYSSGEDYPSTTVTIGGVTFALASFGGGTGIVQLDGNEAVNISTDQTGVNAAYLIVNSAYGQFGATNGSLTFNGNGGLSTVVQLVQGTNIRDHYTAFNNVSTNVFATATYDGGNRFDVYRYDISALGGNLVSIDFTANTSGTNGSPFIAGITTAFEGAGTPAVPEPATWAMMLMGFGMVGFGLRSRRAKVRTNVSFA